MKARLLQFIGPVLAVLAGTMLTGCSGNGADGQQAAMPPPPTAPAPAAANAEAAAGRPVDDEANLPAKALDLSYKAKPVQPAAGKADFSSQGHLPDLFKTEPEEHRASLSGHLLLDDAERDPRRAVEGGEVGVQVKTN